MVVNVAPAEEQEWIVRAQHGDREAFAVLVESYWERLFRWLFHLTRDRHAAEDLTQESLLSAFRALASFRPESRFHAWLFRIAHNAWVNANRVRQRTWEVFPDDALDPSQGPEQSAMSREAMIELTKGVGRLPSEFRSAFLLRVEEDLSFREIAEVLRITEETARWRVFKARQKLLEVMEKHLP